MNTRCFFLFFFFLLFLLPSAHRLLTVGGGHPSRPGPDPLGPAPGGLLQRRGQSIISAMQSYMRLILDGHESRQIFYFFCLNMVSLTHLNLVYSASKKQIACEIYYRVSKKVEKSKFDGIFFFSFENSEKLVQYRPSFFLSISLHLASYLLS